MLVALETSSYLPLIWKTPYSKSIIEKMTDLAENDADFVIQKCSIREALSLVNMTNDWKRNPAVRIRGLLKRLDTKDLRRLEFPSTAIQIMLGGALWLGPKNLNLSRHITFLVADLIDGLRFEEPERDLEVLAEQIDARFRSLQCLMKKHLTSTKEPVRLCSDEMLPYWGDWYAQFPRMTFYVKVLSDGLRWKEATYGTRDRFHYECAQRLQPHRPDLMLVADTGFRKNIRGVDRRRKAVEIWSAANEFTGDFWNT